MTDLLSKLVNRGLVSKLDGDDRRLAKIQEASSTLSIEFTESPSRLIGAVLAGIDPDVPADDPALVAAEDAVVQQWGTMRSVHPDSPINLLRAVLLDACSQAARGPLAAVVWLTAVDQLRYISLGAEGAIVREWLGELAISVEKQALAGLGGEKTEQGRPIKIPKIEVPISVSDAPPANEAALAKNAKTSFPYTAPAANLQVLTQATTNWINAFPAGIASMLAKLQNEVTQSAATNTQLIRSQFGNAFDGMTKIIEQRLDTQRKWLRASQTKYEASSRVQLRALWWAEALYSPSLCTSYRQLPASMATIVMSFDLAAAVGTLVPASIGYLLAETIAKLPSAGFDEVRPVWAILDELREHRGRLPSGWLDPISLPAEGRPSIRDLMVLALCEDGSRYETAKNSLRRRFEQTTNLPEIGHAILRQEQAYRIVQGLS